MNYQDVKELIGIIETSQFVSFELSIEDVSVKMSKCGPILAQTQTPPVSFEPVPVKKETLSAASKEKSEMPKETVLEDGNVVKAPLVGTFYASASPDKPPLASKGAKVKKGDVLCIVEAMKIMNEIISEYDGEIVDVLAENGQLVEYGQPLFLIGS